MTDPGTMTGEGARAAIVTMFRRDLVGPLPSDDAPDDADLQTERLAEPPSFWYLTGFIAPVDESMGASADDPDRQEEMETGAGDLADDDSATAEAADDDSPPEAPSTRRRYMPSSIGLTVLVPEAVEAVDVRLSWGDYVTEPPLPVSVLIAEAGASDEPKVDWIRRARQRIVRLTVPKNGKSAPVLVPDSAAEQRPGGGIGAVAAEEAVLIHQPQIARPGDRLPRRLGRRVEFAVVTLAGRFRTDVVIQRRQQAFDLVLVEAEQAEIVGLAVEGVDLRRQRLFVPGCGERQLIVANAIGSRLRIGKVREPNDGHVLQFQPLRRQEPAVAGDHRAVIRD